MRKKHSFKKANLIRILVLLIAFSVLLYPTVSNYLYERNSSRVVIDYDSTVQDMEEKERQAILEQAAAYNASLSKAEPMQVDPFGISVAGDEEYQSMLDPNGNRIMGYIKIPKINVELPIYHGTEEKVLQVGVGHWTTSSLPIGGETTHAVLTGHRGLPSRMLFTDLDQMEKGDIFYIRVLDQVLAYQVDQILTVLPEETDALRIVEGKDYVTLVTCTPYGVNTHRLLVRGTRIPYEEAVKEEPDQIDRGIKIPFEIRMLLLAFAALVLIAIFFLLLKRRQSRKRKRKRQIDLGDE